jgi:hypothetical protein
MISAYHRRTMWLFLLVFWVLAASTSGRAQTAAVTYDLPLFVTDQALNSPINIRSYWVDMRPGVEFLNDCYVELVYSNSPTLLAGQATLILYFNEIPLANRPLIAQDAPPRVWRVALPRALWKPGFNEVRVVSRQRSIEGLCRDIDNDANWVRLYKSSTLHLERRELGIYPLYAYPFPYLDYLAKATPVNCAWHLPANPSPSEIEAMLLLASDWGKREPLLPLAPRVSTAPPAPWKNTMRLGTGHKLTQVDAKVEEKMGYVAQLLPETPTDASTLIVSGKDTDGLLKAQAALMTPELIAQFEGMSAYIRDWPTQPIIPVPERKPGHFRLSDLGIPRLLLAGAFHQRASVTFLRPVRWDIGKESTLTLRYRHSKTLNPYRSLLTVYVNGVPVTSAKLSVANADGGTIKVRLPLDQLDRSRWVVEIACYHDLGQVDCGKRYDEVAWTVIEGSSELYLAPGKVRGYPTLANFPNFLTPDGHVRTPITLWLSERPSDVQLKLAATIATLAGQRTKQPLAWKVIFGPQTSQPKGHLVIIGTTAEKIRFAGWENILPVCPLRAGGCRYAPNLNIIRDGLKDPAFLMASAAPAAHGIVYAVLSETEAGLARVTTKLVAPDLTRLIDATEANPNQRQVQVCVINRQGRQSALSTISAAEQTEQSSAELNRYTLPMYGIMGLIAVGLLLALIRLIRMFTRKPRTAD